MSDGFYDLFGLDEAVIRFDLKYGFNDFFSLGMGRSSINKTYDNFSKVKVLRQKNGKGGSPISLATFLKLKFSQLSKK